MTQKDERSTQDLTDCLTEQTPTARSLHDLRRRIYSQKIGPGAVKDVAESVDVRRSLVNRMIGPTVIKAVAKIEKHLSGGDSDE